MKIRAAAFGDTTQNRPAAGAVLPWHQTKPGGEVATPVKGFTCANGGNHARRDQGTDARNTHQELAIRFTFGDRLDLTGDGFDALIKPKPILVEPDNDVDHARLQLVLTVLQNGEQRLAKRRGTGSDGDALLDQEGPDLVDRRRAPRYKP